MVGHAAGADGVPQFPGSAGPDGTTGARGRSAGVLTVVVVTLVVTACGGAQAASEAAVVIHRRNFMLASLIRTGMDI
jgi:hypothetical protein